MYRRRRRRPRKGPGGGAGGMPTVASNTFMMMNPMLQQGGGGGWAIEGSRLRHGKTIGVGVYGNVTDSLLDDSKPVAARMLQHTGLASSFTSEVEVMKRLGRDPHLNILGLIGICSDAPRCIVVPLAGNGTLTNFLRESRATAMRGQRISLANVGRFAQQIIDGLCFLASKDVLHQNLRCDSVLLDSSYTCMVRQCGTLRPALYRSLLARTSVVRGGLDLDVAPWCCRAKLVGWRLVSRSTQFLAHPA